MTALAAVLAVVFKEILMIQSKVADVEDAQVCVTGLLTIPLYTLSKYSV